LESSTSTVSPKSNWETISLFSEECARIGAIETWQAAYSTMRGVEKRMVQFERYGFLLSRCACFVLCAACGRHKEIQTQGK
jgi:hypothetical protein